MTDRIADKCESGSSGSTGSSAGTNSSSSTSSNALAPLETKVRSVGDWSEHTSSSGKKYYYNCVSEVSRKCLVLFMNRYKLVIIICLTCGTFENILETNRLFTFRMGKTKRMGGIRKKS